MFRRIQEAITVTDRPVLIMVKTRKFQNSIAANRLEYLLKYCNLDPRSILAISYAAYGKDGIIKKVNDNVSEVEWRYSDFTTINAICRNILREERRTVKKSDHFIKTIEEVVKELGIDYSKKIPTLLGRLAWIETKKNKPFDLFDYKTVIGGVFNNFKNGLELYPIQTINEIYSKLIERIPDKRHWYYGDVVIKAITLLNDEKVNDKWQKRVKAIVYDRLDFVCPFKFAVIKRLVDVNRNLFCVGYPATRNPQNIKMKMLSYFPDAYILEV